MSKKTRVSSLPPLQISPLPVPGGQLYPRGQRDDDELQKPDADSTTTTTLEVEMHELELGRVHELQVAKFEVDVSNASAELLGGVHSEMKAISTKEIRAFETQLSERHSAVVREEERLKNLYFAITEEQKLEFQKSIVFHYQNRNCTLSLPPLVPTKDEHLDKFYIPPKILDRRATLHPFATPGQDPPPPIRCFKDVFYVNNQIANKIYIEGDSGIGKSSFCAKIVLEWCRVREQEYVRCKDAQDKHIEAGAELDDSRTPAHDARDGFLDGTVLSHFRYVFVVSLRDASEVECDMDEMIMHQIVKYLPKDYDIQFLQDILANDCCLVLLDGLDEWLHPDRNLRRCACKRSAVVPFCRTRSSCSVLTTTRPWKMSKTKLRDSEIDKHLDIVGLEDADALVKRVLESLNGRYRRKLTKEQFDEEIDKRNCRHLVAYPVICMQLLCLWFSGNLHGTSQARIYCSMVDMLFGRAKEKKDDASDLGASSALYQSFGSSDVELPRFFQLHRNIVDNCNFFIKLCDLAFDTFFTQDRESSIVFDGKVVNEFLSGLEWIAALETGILSQTQSLSTLTERRTTYTFLHRSFQEFLAAAYLHVCCERLEECLGWLHEWLPGSDEAANVTVRLTSLLEEMYRGHV